MGFLELLKNAIKPNEHTYRITEAEFFEGRDKKFPDEMTDVIRSNAKELLFRVNGLLNDLNWKDEAKVTSGWRPRSINKAVGGAPSSHHLYGRAIDIADPGQKLALAILKNPDLLIDYELWIENPKYTPTWVHLDMGTRPERSVRMFSPK